MSQLHFGNPLNLLRKQLKDQTVDLSGAASAGFYEYATGRKYPRVQLFTTEGLRSGQQRAQHSDQSPDLDFKQAKAENNAAQKDLI